MLSNIFCYCPVLHPQILNPTAVLDIALRKDVLMVALRCTWFISKVSGLVLDKMQINFREICFYIFMELSIAICLILTC